MARKGRMDRGLYIKINAQGKPCWHVRLFHKMGREISLAPSRPKPWRETFTKNVSGNNVRASFSPNGIIKMDTLWLLSG